MSLVSGETIANARVLVRCEKCEVLGLPSSQWPILQIKNSCHLFTVTNGSLRMAFLSIEWSEGDFDCSLAPPIRGNNAAIQLQNFLLSGPTKPLGAVIEGNRLCVSLQDGRLTQVNGPAIAITSESLQCSEELGSYLGKTLDWIAVENLLVPNCIESSPLIFVYDESQNGEDQQLRVKLEEIVMDSNLCTGTTGPIAPQLLATTLSSSKTLLLSASGLVLASGSTPCSGPSRSVIQISGSADVVLLMESSMMDFANGTDTLLDIESNSLAATLLTSQLALSIPQDTALVNFLTRTWAVFELSRVDLQLHPYLNQWPSPHENGAPMQIVSRGAANVVFDSVNLDILPLNSSNLGYEVLEFNQGMKNPIIRKLPPVISLHTAKEQAIALEFFNVGVSIGSVVGSEGTCHGLGEELLPLVTSSAERLSVTGTCNRDEHCHSEYHCGISTPSRLALSVGQCEDFWNCARAVCDVFSPDELPVAVNQTAQEIDFASEFWFTVSSQVENEHDSAAEVFGTVESLLLELPIMIEWGVTKEDLKLDVIFPKKDSSITLLKIIIRVLKEVESVRGKLEVEKEMVSTVMQQFILSTTLNRLAAVLDGVVELAGFARTNAAASLRVAIQDEEKIERGHELPNCSDNTGSSITLIVLLCVTSTILAILLLVSVVKRVRKSRTADEGEREGSEKDLSRV